MPSTATDPHDHLRADPVLAPLVERYGPLELSPADRPFARLVRSVLRQQVSSAAADAIEGRLRETVALTPGAVLDADPERLRDAGLSAAKTRYVRAIAETWREEGYSRATFADLADDAVRDRLTAITGVGRWTADMFLIFGLGREDVFPVGDLAIRRGTADLCDLAADDRTAIRDRAGEWRPFRSYAALYVWQHYEDGESAVGRA